MKTKIKYIILLLLVIQTGYAQEASKFTVKIPNKTFIGAILEPGSINSDTHQFLDVPLNPITISYSLPMKSQEITPGYDNMMKAIREGLQQNNILKPNYQFSSSIDEIKSYEELAIYFGQKINPSLFFGTSRQKQKKTIVVLSISQSFFSVDMDLPESLSDDPTVLEQKDKLIYVSSIQFGRKAVAIIESDFDSQTVKTAIKDIISKTENNEASILDESMAVIANATVRCMTIGNDNMEETDPDNPLKNLINYLNKKATPEDFGMPITFSAAYLKDNSVFVNKFTK